MADFVNISGTNRQPEAVVVITQSGIDPDSCSHSFGYNDGLLITDTATDGVSTWVKTYVYTLGSLTSESKWVKQ